MRVLRDVIAVVARPDHKLVLEFEGGERRVYDMRPLIARKPFDRLRDPAKFAAAFVDLGTVCWPGEIDIDPETLYERSVPADRAALQYKLDDLTRGAGRMEEIDWGPDVGLERRDPPSRD